MFNLLLNLLRDLSAIPGLGFAASLLQQLESKRAAWVQRSGDVQNQGRAAMHGARSLRDAPQSVKGSKRKT